MSAATVVLLHGQPDSSASFWALRRALRARLGRDIRIVAPDRPGYGANPAPATDYPGNAHWLDRWLSRTDSGPVVLLAHSWAGGVGILAAAQNPVISGLILLASIGPDCLLPIDPVLSAPVLGELIAYTTLSLGRGPLGARAEHVLSAHLDAQDAPYARASGYATLRRPMWRSFLTEQRALTRQLELVSAALSRVTVPTLVISGSSDHVIPQRTGYALASEIAAARRIEIEGGHDLQLRQPEQVAEHVSGLVREVLAAPLGRR